MASLTSKEKIESRILIIRGQRVMLDRDLAELYDVETKYLNRQVKRNKERFSEEFMFKLTPEERLEVVTNWHHLKTLKFSPTLPSAFTEHGVVMLATILNSNLAIKMSILIVKTFIKLRGLLLTHKELGLKIKELELKVGKHDGEIKSIFEAIKQLMIQEQKPKRTIGFIVYLLALVHISILFLSAFHVAI